MTSSRIQANTVLLSRREPFEVSTSDGYRLVGETAWPAPNPQSENLRPAQPQAVFLLLHPLPTAGGFMDSHVFKKAANRLPALANVVVVRFNFRGVTSDAGTSEGYFDGGVAEAADVEALIDYASSLVLGAPLWLVGWSFGADMAVNYGRDDRVSGVILLSPPLKYLRSQTLTMWADSERPLVAVVPEHDDYLQPEQARERFAVVPHARVIGVNGAKHLWVGEKYVHRVLQEMVQHAIPGHGDLPEEVNTNLIVSS